MNMPSNQAETISLAPRFSGVKMRARGHSTALAVSRAPNARDGAKTAKAVDLSFDRLATPLKRGVNERQFPWMRSTFGFGFRSSDFLRISGFGFRIS
jgi:hypothetical protein